MRSTQLHKLIVGGVIQFWQSSFLQEASFELSSEGSVGIKARKGTKHSRVRNQPVLTMLGQERAECYRN